MRSGIVVVAGLLALAGCSGGAEEAATGPATSAPTLAQSVVSTPAEPTERSVQSACEDVSAEMLAAIDDGAEAGTGMKAVKGAAVKSPDFENVYFLAVRFSATGVDDQVGVWASNSLTAGDGVILAVDGTAQEFTVWPDADSTDAEIGGADPSVSAAKDCLG